MDRNACIVCLGGLCRKKIERFPSYSAPLVHCHASTAVRRRWMMSLLLQENWKIDPPNVARPTCANLFDWARRWLLDNGSIRRGDLDLNTVSQIRLWSVFGHRLFGAHDSIGGVVFFDGIGASVVGEIVVAVVAGSAVEVLAMVLEKKAVG